MALTAEAGELAAEFQWLEGAASLALDAEHLARVRDEARYPADQVRGQSRKYDEY